MMTYEEEIEAAVKILKEGKVMLYPTDTIWGLGCDATNPKAVEKIYKIKRRSENKSLIALIDSEERLTQYVKVVPAIAYDLIHNAANPISIVYPGAQNLAKNAIGSDKTVCIRITTHEFCKEVVKRFGKAIASTSANLSGQPTPLIFNQISDEIKQAVDHIVGLYQDELKLPKASTIIKLETDGSFEILRH
ncbi:MAG: threonylcarbamoyl-AMP synthase [Bacteroidetes bacterium]|nr:threonylcarbamoyl-AMP synthase [Bacteroidota bacterium]MBU1578050.1 threonylcarbamoyl-AMP synthase [Bacteroidota bacterium]MBU2466267.1 threonylcarbamoyl-AMP synthase [Bacteroidota bacterium]MBU2559179.1 threonylcarbamoyl-AMP synthase [Bacteroidota bacterium]